MKENKEKEEIDTTAEDSDPEKPEVEKDSDELIRRLKRHNLSEAVEHF